MTRLAAAAAAAVALLVVVTSGARITGRVPSFLGDAGGEILHISGEGFSEGQFSELDPSLGNRVALVNEEDEIECKVIENLSNANRIACATGPRTKPSAPSEYEVIVYSDGVRAEGSATVEMPAVSLLRSLPGQEVALGKDNALSNARQEDSKLGVKLTVQQRFLRAGEPFAVTAQVVDAATGDPQDESLSKNQVIVGGLFEQKIPFTRPTEVERFFSIFESTSAFTVKNSVDRPVKRYIIIIKIVIIIRVRSTSILEYVEVPSERLVVYPPGKPLPADSVAMSLEMEMVGRKVVPGIEMQLEDTLLQWLMDTFDMEEYGVIWGAVTVPVTEEAVKKASFEVNGPEEQVTAAKEALRQALKASKPKLEIDIQCSRRPMIYKLRRLTDVTVKASQGNRMMLPLAEATGLQNSTRILTKAGLHKLSRDSL